MALEFVEINAYDVNDSVIFHHIYTAYEWHEQNKPIIDSYDERAKLNVDRIEGLQYDSNKQLSEHWIILYKKTGELQEELIITNGRVTHNVLDLDRTSSGK